MQESAYSPSGSKILNEPHLQQQRPYVTKTMVFSFFLFIEQLLSHVCGDIAYSAQGPPRVAVVIFMIYMNYFYNSCYFVGFRNFSCQQVAVRAKQQFLFLDLQNFITFGILLISLLLPLLLEAKSSSCECCIVFCFLRCL